MNSVCNSCNVAECFLLETLRWCLTGGSVEGTACGQVTQDLTCRVHECIAKFVNINVLTTSWLACVIVTMMTHHCANKVDNGYIYESQYYCCITSRKSSIPAVVTLKNVLVFVVNKYCLARMLTKYDAVYECPSPPYRCTNVYSASGHVTWWTGELVESDLSVCLCVSWLWSCSYRAVSVSSHWCEASGTSRWCATRACRMNYSCTATPPSLTSHTPYTHPSSTSLRGSLHSHSHPRTSGEWQGAAINTIQGTVINCTQGA